MKELGMTARQLSIHEAVTSLPKMVSPAQIAQVRELAAALFDQELAQELAELIKWSAITKNVRGFSGGCDGQRK